MIIAIVTTVTFYIRAFATTSIKGTNVHCGGNVDVVNVVNDVIELDTQQLFVQLQ